MKEQEKAMMTTENSSLDGKSFASKTKAMTQSNGAKRRKSRKPPNESL